MRLSRRALLLGGVAAAGGVAAVELSSGDPSSPHAVPDAAGGTVVSGSFRSVAMNRVVGFSIAYPAGAAPLPFVLELHGKGGDHTTALRSLRYDRFLSAAVASGVPPFAIVTVDGGRDSYYHQRTSGENPQAMIAQELFPLLRARGLATERFALAGWSMGGYGATLLAEELGAGRVAALAVDSPAIWRRYRDSAKGAFDSRADFDKHDVLAHASRLAGIAVRVTCGTSDPLLPGARALLAAVGGSVTSELGPGAHDPAWWQHAAPGQLAFVGRHLTP